jgi:bacterioferritin (cytochrome b1)
MFEERNEKRQQVGSNLQRDLLNEIQHMHFYLRAASEVRGLHREEIREFFLKEAHEEMNHVHEFSDMVCYFERDIPQSSFELNWKFGHDPSQILWEVIRMEEEVAENYALRLVTTEGSSDPWIAAAHVFYEDQIKNSQKTAWEVRQWLKSFHS